MKAPLSPRGREMLLALAACSTPDGESKAFYVTTRRATQTSIPGIDRALLTTFFSLETRGLADRRPTRNPGSWWLHVTAAGAAAAKELRP
jgi:hypothetical protein